MMPLVPDIRMTAPPDVHSLLVEYLLRDTELSSLLGDDIYAGPYPEGVHLPAMRFFFPDADALAPPSMDVWTFTGQFDIHGDSWAEVSEATKALIVSLVGLVGSSHEQGSLVSLSPWNVRTATDSSWTPPKFQKIVAVTLTARNKQ